MSCTDIDERIAEVLYSLREEESIAFSRLAEITESSPYTIRHAAARLELRGLAISHRYGRLSLSEAGKAHVRDRLSRCATAMRLIRAVGLEDKETARRMADVMSESLLNALESKICVSEAVVISSETQNSPSLLQLHGK